MSQLKYCTILDLAHLMRPAPYAFVTTLSDHARLAAMLPPPPTDPVRPINQVMGIPVYSFPDVPDRDLIAFSGQRSFGRYLELRARVGHVEALRQMRQPGPIGDNARMLSVLLEEDYEASHG